MPKFIVERDIPEAGKLQPPDLTNISRKSRAVLEQLGTKIQWLESFVTADKVYCVYIAPDAETIREHARLGEFPANRISRIVRIIDPTTAEGDAA